MSAVETAPTGQTPFEVELLDEGEEPRQELRYEVTSDAVEKLDVSMMTEIEVASEQEATVAVSQPVTLHVEMGPTKETDEGPLRHTMQLTDLTIQNVEQLDPDQASELRDILEPLTRIEGTIEMTRRGLVRDASFDIPAEVPPRARALLGNLRAAVSAIPLPEEEVGVGARWQARRTVDLALVRAQQSIGYRLTNMEGNQGEVVLSINQSADPQALTNVAPEFEGRAQVYETSGVGAADFDLQSLAPVSAWVDITTRMRAEFEDASMASPLQFRVRSLLEMQRAPADDRPVGQRGSTNTERGSHRASTAPNSEN